MSTLWIDAGSRTSIIGDSNASVEFESLGHRDSGTNHRNHFGLRSTVHTGAATPHAAHVRRSPHRLPRFRGRLVGHRDRPRDPDAARLAVGTRPGGHGLLPRRMGVPRRRLSGVRRRLSHARCRLHRSAGHADHVRDLGSSLDDEMDGSRPIPIRRAARPPHHRLPRARVDRAPFEGSKSIVGLRTVGISATRLRWCVSHPVGFVVSRPNGPLGGLPSAVALDGRSPGRGGRRFAVRGEFVIVAAVYDGPAYDALRSELTQALKVFEERSWRQLGTWEDATTVAESAAEGLSNFLEQPERTTPPRLPKVSRPEMKSGKAS